MVEFHKLDFFRKEHLNLILEIVNNTMKSSKEIK